MSRSAQEYKYPEIPALLSSPVYDNHTHLTRYFEDMMGYSTREAIDVAESVGVRGIVQVGFDVDTSRQSVELAENDSRVLAAVALHPNEVPILDETGKLDESLEIIDELASKPRVRAIGETGLDYFRTGTKGQKVQQDSFREHIKIAHEHGLAVQIHDRDAHEDVVNILLESKKAKILPEKVVFHCFSGDSQLARICNENNWYMSFAGTVTFKNAQNIHEAAVVAKKNLILCETDSPFLTPHPFRGQVNSSYMIPLVVRKLAELRGENVSELCSMISSNSVDVYKMW